MTSEVIDRRLRSRLKGSWHFAASDEELHMQTDNIIATYIESFNEHDATRRAELLRQVFVEDATYRDALLEGEGIDGLGRVAEGFQAKFPTWRFTRGSTTDDSVTDRLRFTWEFGPDEGEAPIAGTDFVIMRDGKFAVVTGFVDRAPADLG